MAIKDLREYISSLEDEGELLRIQKEVDWNLEVGAIIRKSYDLKAKAPLFEKIKDYPEGYRILGAPAGVSSKPNRFYARVAISLEMRPDSSYEEITEEYLNRKKNPIKPIVISEGACKEEVQIGEEVDLFKLPAPYIHEGDGGRYISTWHAIITRDPDSEWVNWGMYRQMIHSKNTLGGLMHPNQHVGLHYYEYEKQNRPMEFAVAIGTEPITPIVAATMLPVGVNEADVIGALRKEPLDLVKCETVNLYVPAHSEIVFEGVVFPNERKDEGPFGEYTGYRVSERAPRPVYHVKAITHRKNPVLPVSCMGVPIDDSAAIMPLVQSAEILECVRNQGFPVRMVYSPPEGVSHMVFVSTKVPYPNYSSHLANAIWGSAFGKGTHFLLIVDDDVDVTNREEVIWAMATRCHPYKGIHRDTQGIGHPLLPFLSIEERRNCLGAKVLFDCTWPKEWPKEAIPVKASFDVLWPGQMQQKVLKNWKGYGYDEDL